MSKKIRWVCPDCGKGKNLGPRPRKNATDRFCVECSIRTGVLVERTVPARQRAAQAAYKRTLDKEQKARDRERMKWIVQTRDGPVDVRAEHKRLWKLACKLHPPLKERFRNQIPPLTLHRGSGWGCSGRAYYQSGRIHLTAGVSKRSLLGTLIHEIAHQMRFTNGDLIDCRGRYQHHDDRFYSLERLLRAESGCF